MPATARHTLTMPAATPRKNITIIPHGRVPSPAVDRPAERGGDGDRPHQFETDAPGERQGAAERPGIVARRRSSSCRRQAHAAPPRCAVADPAAAPQGRLASLAKRPNVLRIPVIAPRRRRNGAHHKGRVGSVSSKPRSRTATRKRQSAAPATATGRQAVRRSRSAACRSTETSCDTPFSAMVTPNRRSTRDIVRR